MNRFFIHWRQIVVQVMGLFGSFLHSLAAIHIKTVQGTSNYSEDHAKEISFI